jgi:hypothetical protein
METQKVVTVNGSIYVINAFPSSVGFPLLAKLTKYATPIIAEMTKVSEKEGAEEDIDLSAIMQNLFFDGTEGFVELVFSLIKDVQKDGMKINIDIEFKMNYVAMLELALEVIKLNFNDVFQKLGIRFD